MPTVQNIIKSLHRISAEVPSDFAKIWQNSSSELLLRTSASLNLMLYQVCDRRSAYDVSGWVYWNPGLSNSAFSPGNHTNHPAGHVILGTIDTGWRYFRWHQGS